MRHPDFPGACFICLLLFLSSHSPAGSQKFSIPEGYPESLRQQRDDFTAALIEDLKNPQLWKQLSHVYMNMADDLFTAKSEKIEAYDKGLKAATQAYSPSFRPGTRITLMPGKDDFGPKRNGSWMSFKIASKQQRVISLCLLQTVVLIFLFQPSLNIPRYELRCTANAGAGSQAQDGAHVSPAPFSG